jgi:hypothetical protein
MPIRSRDHDSTAIPYRAKQPLENHCVSNIGDLKLIETENLRLMADISADLNERITAVSGDRASRVKTRVDAHHEFVEMHATCRYCGRHSRGKEVGETRLAGADISIDVEATFVILRVSEGFLKSRKAVHERCLARVGRQTTFVK